MSPRILPCWWSSSFIISFLVLLLIANVVNGSSRQNPTNSNNNSETATPIGHNKNNNTSSQRFCDEAKCRTPVSDLKGAFECWAFEGSSLLCADDYVGHVIDFGDEEDDGDYYTYYTCCPPEYQVEEEQVNTNDDDDTSIFLERQCDSSYCTSSGDDCLVVPNVETPTCNQESVFNTSRFVTTGVTTRTWPWSELIQYTCCRPSPKGEQKDNKNETTIMIEETPWTNDMEGCSAAACTTPGGDCVAAHQGLWMELVTCDQDSIYKHPYITFKSRSRFGRLVAYSCCETLDEDTEHYLQNGETRMFRLSVISPLVVCSLVFVLLVYFTGAILSSKLLRNQAFTLYVVSLQIPDSALNMTTICYMSYRLIADPTFVAGNALTTVYCACACANVWINVLITREIFILLLRSNKRMRTNPPTVRKVIQQISALYLTTIAIWIIYLILDGREAFSKVRFFTVGHFALGFYSLFVVIIPFGYLSYVCFRIQREHLLPRTGRTRGITLYFARIIVVFYVMYIPAGIVAAFRPSISMIIFSLQGVFSIASARSNDEIHDVTAFLDMPNFQRFRQRASSALFASSEFFTSAEFRLKQKQSGNKKNQQHRQDEGGDGGNLSDKEDSEDGGTGSDHDQIVEDPWGRTTTRVPPPRRSSIIVSRPTTSTNRAGGGRQQQRTPITTGSRSGVIASLFLSSSDSDRTSLEWPEEESGEIIFDEEDQGRHPAGTPATTPGCFDNTGIVSNANLPFSTCRSSEVIDS